MNINAARTMTCLRPNYVSTAICSRTSFPSVRQQQQQAHAAIAVHRNYTSRRPIVTKTIENLVKPGLSPLDRQRRQQQQIASYSSHATMPTPTASRVAIIGAGTVGATIAFSLIGMLVLSYEKEMVLNGIEG